jgi:hypothetical protein
MTDFRLYQKRSLKKAYAFAKSGNSIWAQVWLNQANSYLWVTPRQVAYINRLLKQAWTREDERATTV